MSLAGGGVWCVGWFGPRTFFVLSYRGILFSKYFHSTQKIKFCVATKFAKWKHTRYSFKAKISNLGKPLGAWPSHSRPMADLGRQGEGVGRRADRVRVRVR